jgi:hypothetical protein
MAGRIPTPAIDHTPRPRPGTFRGGVGRRWDGVWAVGIRDGRCDELRMSSAVPLTRLDSCVCRRVQTLESSNGQPALFQ